MPETTLPQLDRLEVAADAPAGQPPYLLTAEQVEQFDRDGYLILRNRVDAGLLARLQDASRAWMAQGLDRDQESAQDWLFADRPSGKVMFRVDYIHAKGQPASLELLGSPAVLGIAESLAGPNFVPTYESMVFKSAGDGAPIPWHQDAVHSRNFRLFNIDVYLDESRPGAGALFVVPGSQHRRTDACGLADRYGWDVPGAIEVDLQPGDVLVHDDMIVHGSPPVTGKALRRTVYLEFRAAEHILREGPWTPQWMDARLRLLTVGLQEHARRAEPAARYRWRIEPRLRPVPAGDAETELRIAHEVHTPGEWCSAGSS